jgi:hypothetical protein
LHEYDKALDDLAAAIKDNGDAEECFHQAWAYWAAGKKPEAATALEAAKAKDFNPKKLDPREVSVYEQMKIDLL